MTTNSFFALAVAGLLMLLLGAVLAFGGYRFCAVLLPIFGFLFGFGFGAQMVQALFGEGFLATLTSWAVGLFFALSFAAVLVPLLPLRRRPRRGRGGLRPRRGRAAGPGVRLRVPGLAGGGRRGASPSPSAPWR